MSRVSGAGFLACHRVRQGGSPADVSHLLVAHDALRTGYWGASHIAVCGIEIHPGSAAGAEADEDPRYCPACVRAAVRWSTRGTAR
jgi:hypothetical protein